jgi:DNA polymerase I
MFILTHYSKDKGLIGNIMAGKDIHTGNVELVWGEPYDDVARAKKDKDWDDDRAWYLRDLRNKVKVVGFGLNYGKAAHSLARELGFFERTEKEHPEWSDWDIRRAAKAEAQALIDTYFSKIPGAAKFIKGTYRRVADTKFVETFLGRRRWLRQIMEWSEKMDHIQRELDSSGGRRDLCWCNDCKASRDGERRSVNTIIQGTAADIVMCAMIKCFFDKRLRELGVKMLLQIHDELVFECPEENVEAACPIIQEDMEHPGINLRVPLKAAPGVGDNWVEAK